MSIAASKMSTPHIRSMKDDLESLLYVVLYCALRWLPVDSSISLDWWLTQFFSISSTGSATEKLLNATTRNYTEQLKSATGQSQAVLDWLNAAMDLHYKPMKSDTGELAYAANPAWNNGEALKAMWEVILAKDLPDNDRQENPIPDIVLQETHSLHATYTINTPMFPHGFHPISLQQLPTTITPHLSPKQSYPGSFNADNTHSLDWDPKRQHDSDQDTLPKKSRKLEQIGSKTTMPTTLVPGSSQQKSPPLPMRGRAARSSVKQITSEPAIASTPMPTVRRSTRKRNTRK